ncbi:MAG: DnaJ domain-containing protein [Halioglobus sp.]
MPRLFLILAIAAVIYILYRRITGLPPHKRRAQYFKLGLAVAVIIVVALTLTGKMHWLGAALTGLLVAARQLLPTLIRLFPMLSSLKRSNSASAGQHSTVETAVVRMHLSHDSGTMDGEVLKGPYTGWHLADMDKSQLQELLENCQDADSLALLDSYLQQRFGDNNEFQHAQGRATTSSSEMTQHEALAVLGLEENAQHDEIVTAHRKLIQKLHPDRGGSDYLAAKINQAKDILLS